MTVKVRNDPGPTFPATGLGTDAEGVEVGFNDDVAVTARVTILRLREQAFILVEEMDESTQAVLFRPFLHLAASLLERSTAATKDDAQITKPSLEPENRSRMGRKGRKIEKNSCTGAFRLR